MSQNFQVAVDVRVRRRGNRRKEGDLAKYENNDDESDNVQEGEIFENSVAYSQTA